MRPFVPARQKPGFASRGSRALPPDVNLADGLTQEEAVAIALWNSPSFQATLVDLGVARADLAEAGLLRNPIFSLLFPIGPKQLEFTLQYPFDVLVQRPARVAAAKLNAQAIGERLVWDALSLVAQVRTAHADAIVADRRLTLATENADLTRRLADITDAACARATSASSRRARREAAAARAEVVRRAAQHDRDLARLTLAALLGLDRAPDQLQPQTVGGLRRGAVSGGRQPPAGSAGVPPGRSCGRTGDRGRDGARAMGATPGSSR